MIHIEQDDIIKNWKAIDKPLVSIKCLTYNHEKYIESALDSFLMQKTDFPFEVIVHDDASTDRTACIIREYEEKFPLIIKPIYETENQYSKHDGNLSKIVNSRIKGKYIAYCEGDDFWINENKLQLQFNALSNNPDCVACFCKVNTCNEDGEKNEITCPTNEYNEGIYTSTQLVDIYFNKEEYCFHTSGYFIRKDLLDYILSTEYKSYMNGDENILRACFEKGSCYYISEPLSCYRLMAKGSWSEKNSKKSDDLRIKDRIRFIQGNMIFDKCTNYRFHSQISDWLLKNKLFYILSTRNKKEKKDLMTVFEINQWDMLTNKKILIFRIKFFFKRNFPSLYYFLKWLIKNEK